MTAQNNRAAAPAKKWLPIVPAFVKHRTVSNHTMSDNNRPYDDLPADDDEGNELDDLFQRALEEAQERREPTGDYEPIAQDIDKGFDAEDQSKKAIRLAWGMLGNMIVQHAYPIPNTDLCTDEDRVKFARHLHNLIMSLSMSILKTFDDGEL